MELIDVGWREFFEEPFRSFRVEGLTSGRVTCEERGLYVVVCESGHVKAEVRGKMRHRALSRAEFPCVGDWVVMRESTAGGRAVIEALLPRRTAFSRKAVLSGGMPDSGGRTDCQVLAANVDVAFLVAGLDREFNARRLERYLAVAWDSGAKPVVLLNKADICRDVDSFVSIVRQSAVGVPVYPVSAVSGEGMDQVIRHLPRGDTAVFLGSSGVGKSSIINALMGEERLAVGSVREADDRGRHTTTHRELIVLPQGGVVIDTPGLREIGLWDDRTGVRRVFEDIEKLAGRCRFRDCTHATEPDCAVRGALKKGELERKRFENYQKLLREQEFVARRRQKGGQRRAERQQDKRIRNYFKQRKKLRDAGIE